MSAPDNDETQPLEAIKVLSLHQPWASLVALGVKTIETRSWAAPKSLIGQRIAIHAAAKRPARHGSLGDYRYDRYDDEWYMRLRTQNQFPPNSYLPLGEIVATARLHACLPMIDPCACEWHSEHPRGVAACIHAAIDGQVIVHTPDEPMHTTVLVEQAYGDYRSGRWAWMLADIDALDAPVPFKGGQGLSRSWVPVS
jgi:hypothetical protein